MSIYVLIHNVPRKGRIQAHSTPYVFRSAETHPNPVVVASLLGVVLGEDDNLTLQYVGETIHELKEQ